MNQPVKGDSTCTQIINTRPTPNDFGYISVSTCQPFSQLAVAICPLPDWVLEFLLGCDASLWYHGCLGLATSEATAVSHISCRFMPRVHIIRLPQTPHDSQDQTGSIIKVEKITGASSLAIHPLAHHPLFFPPQSCPHTLKHSVYEVFSGGMGQQGNNLGIVTKQG